MSGVVIHGGSEKKRQLRLQESGSLSAAKRPEGFSRLLWVPPQDGMGNMSWHAADVLK